MSQFVFSLFYPNSNQLIDKIVTGSDMIEATVVKSINKPGVCELVLPLREDFEIISQEGVGLIIEDSKGILYDTYWIMNKFSEEEDKFLLEFTDGIGLLDYRYFVGSNEIDGQVGQIIQDLIRKTFIDSDIERRINLSITEMGGNTTYLSKDLSWKPVLSSINELINFAKDSGIYLFMDVLLKGNYKQNIALNFILYRGARGNTTNETISTKNPDFLFGSFNIDYDKPNVAYVAGSGRGENRIVGTARKSNATGLIRKEVFKSFNSSDLVALQAEATQLINEKPTIDIKGKLVGELLERFNFGDTLIIEHRGFYAPSIIASEKLTMDTDGRLSKEIILESL